MLCILHGFVLVSKVGFGHPLHFSLRDINATLGLLPSGLAETRDVV